MAKKHTGRAKKPFPFLRLPIELRISIYELFTAPQLISYTVPPLSRVYRQVEYITEDHIENFIQCYVSYVGACTASNHFGRTYAAKGFAERGVRFFLDRIRPSDMTDRQSALEMIEKKIEQSSCNDSEWPYKVIMEELQKTLRRRWAIVKQAREAHDMVLAMFLSNRQINFEMNSVIDGSEAKFEVQLGTALSAIPISPTDLMKILRVEVMRNCEVLVPTRKVKNTADVAVDMNKILQLLQSMKKVVHLTIKFEYRCTFFDKVYVVMEDQNLDEASRAQGLISAHTAAAAILNVALSDSTDAVPKDLKEFTVWVDHYVAFQMVRDGDELFKKSSPPKKSFW